MKRIKRGGVYLNSDGDVFVALTTKPDIDNDVKLFDLEANRTSFQQPEDLTRVKGKDFTTAVVKRDGYEFAAFKRGKEVYLTAGCRVFYSIADAKQHWSNGKRGHHADDMGYIDNIRKQANTRRLAAMKAAYAKMKEKL